MPEKTKEQFDIEIQHAKAKLADARVKLLRIPGVFDVRVGLKETGGKATQQVVFRVYVARKRPSADIASTDRIPTEIAGIATDVIGRERDVRHDVICGGMHITQDTWCGKYGTLGAIGLATAGNTHVSANTPLLLTNHHVAHSVGDVVGHGNICDSWCCECCDIGRLTDAGLTNRVDGAVGTLHPEVRFSHDILGVGAIRGTGVATIGMIVVKYGHRTGFTRGRVTDDDDTIDRDDDHAHFDHQIRVAPEPGFDKMSDHGDSGSVYVEEATRRIVGLNHTGTDAGIAKGSHIADVMDLFKMDFPVTGTPGAIPLVGIPEGRFLEPVLEPVMALERDLADTAFGRDWADLIRAHAPEVRRLVNHHRAAKVAWQRCQGPAFLAHFLKSAREPTHRVPREIAGTRVENAIVSMAAVFQEYGSADLAEAVAAHYLTVLECAERTGTAGDVMANVRLVAGGRPAAPKAGHA
ncbi:MAG: hypothetical protein P0111_14395 [Nitrospira sp.]|nr:hypothetical protein [Nitrospira sp.]